MDRPCFAICRQDAPADDLFTEDVSSYWTDVDGILKRNMWKIDHTTSYCEDVKAHYIDFGSTSGRLPGRRAEFGGPPDHLERPVPFRSG